MGLRAPPQRPHRLPLMLRSATWLALLQQKQFVMLPAGLCRAAVRKGGEMSATLGHLGVALANQEQAIETELQRRRQPVTMPANGSKGKLNNTSNSNTPSKKLDAAAARSIVAAKSGSGAAAPDAGDEDGVELRSTEIMHVMCRATGKKIEIAGWRVKIHAARCVVQPCIVCLAHKPNAHVANVQTGPTAALMQPACMCPTEAVAQRVRECACMYVMYVACSYVHCSLA